MNTLNESQTDVVIVGGGPIGLETAVVLQRAGLTATILEAGSIGNTMSWWAPQTRWFSSNDRIAIAGVPLLTPDQTKCTREQYISYLCSVAMQFRLQIRCYERVESIERIGRELRIVSRRQSGIQRTNCRAVVLATGGTDRPRRLGIPGEDLPHVDHYLREPHRYFGRHVLIVGGRNSAVEAALRLHHCNAKVTLSYRQPQLNELGLKYWLLPEIRGLIASGKIGAHFGTSPRQISDSHVVLAAGENAPPIEVTCDNVLLQIGYEQDKSLMQNAGVQLRGENARPTFNEDTMETNVPGVYVAGTAIAGTQSSSYKIFLENCHDHASKIAAHLTGQCNRQDLQNTGHCHVYAEPES